MHLRMRVFLKSPVREFRTPGSVRGLSGNWQFYRDGFIFGAICYLGLGRDSWLEIEIRNKFENQFIENRKMV